jgi:chromosome segregation ATPase
MDPTTLVVAGSTIAVGIGALLKGWGKRDEASAAGVLALVGQIEALNGRCNTLESEVLVLRADLEKATTDHAAEREQRIHYEGQVKLLQTELATTKAAARRLTEEWEQDKLRGRPTHSSERPGKRR